MRIYGKNSITERLKINPASIRQILLEEPGDLSGIEQIVKSRKIPVRYLSKKEFSKQAPDIRAQGIIAEIGEFIYADFEDILFDKSRQPSTLLFLDNLNDPQNLGGILRTLACLGGFVAVLPKHDSVEVTEAVLRVASGGENYVPVCKFTNLSLAIQRAKESGYWIGGAVVEGGEDLRQGKFNFPLGIVMGSEGQGIRPGLIRNLDFKWTIPMVKAGGFSFNVTVATAIICYEAVRQLTADTRRVSAVKG